MSLTLRSIWLGAGTLIAGTFAVGRLIVSTPDRLPTPLAGPAQKTAAPAPPVGDSVVAVGLRLRGVDYLSGGTTPATGFDCSGFVRYCFARLGVAVPPSSALQSQAGREVPREQARPGDIIIFAGTAEGSRTPGHTGIVISRPGEPLRFVHSSSARKVHGVKISQVDSTGYEQRLLSVRRVLEDTTVARPAPVLAEVPAPPPPSVAELEPVPVPVVVPAPAPAPRIVVAAKAPTRRAGSRVRSTRRHSSVAPKHRTIASHVGTRAVSTKKKVTPKAATARKAAVGKKAPATKKTTAAKKSATKKKPVAKSRR